MAAPFCDGSWGSATPAQLCWEALAWAETVVRGGRNLNQKFESAPRYRRNHPPYWPHRRQALNLGGASFGGHHWGLVTPAQPCWEPLARAVTVARGQKTELRNSNRRLAPPLPPSPAAPRMAEPVEPSTSDVYLAGQPPDAASAPGGAACRAVSAVTWQQRGCSERQ